MIPKSEFRIQMESLPVGGRLMRDSERPARREQSLAIRHAKALGFDIKTTKLNGTGIEIRRLK